MLLPISLYLILYLQASVGDVVRKGKCPNIRNQPGFKIDKVSTPMIDETITTKQKLYNV